MGFLTAVLVLAFGTSADAEAPYQPPASPVAAAIRAAEKPKVNINKATLEELIELPGVGKVLAQRVIDGRPYRRVDDLENVDGIGPKKMKELRPLIRVK